MAKAIDVVLAQGLVCGPYRVCRQDGNHVVLGDSIGDPLQRALTWARQLLTSIE